MAFIKEDEKCKNKLPCKLCKAVVSHSIFSQLDHMRKVHGVHTLVWNGNCWITNVTWDNENLRSLVS